MEDPPYKAEYAKTGRAGCRKCKSKIDQGVLRIAAMVQSFHHDGKDAHWFHSRCFFDKHRPKSVEEVDNYDSLRYDDQQNIKKKIEEMSGMILPEPSTSKGSKSKGKKRAAENTNAALNDFGVEYSKSSRAECVGCNGKIMKEDLRVKKVVYDTEVGMKFGGQPKWHHLECFVSVRHDYGFYVGGESLPGFNSLSAADKKKVKEALKAITVDENMVKKFKSEPKDEVDTAVENNLEEKIKKQNKIMYKIRDKLEALCSKSDLQNILFANNSCMIEGVDGLRDRCADILTFGALEKCNKCGKGDFIFARHGYKCNGMIDEWTKCGNFQEKPDRIKCKIPSALKGEEGGFFAKYKSKVENRAVRPAPVDVSKKLNKSMDSNEPRVQRKREPLYNMHVVIIGETSQPREDLKRKIEKMGGKLVTKIQEKIAVVISNAEEVEKMNSRIRMVKDFDIQVVPEKFIDEIVGLSPTETIEKIKSMSICKWGSDPLSRIPTEEERHHRESIYEKKSGSSSKVQIKLKNGTAIDPESGLDDVAHVYKHDGVLYTSVMSKTDIEKNLNSFYKLQVLEADNGRDFWVFRSWGRIGTTIGNTKIENFHSADAAVEEFERLFEEKTGNMFNSSIPFKKHKDKFCIVEVDYDEDKKVKEMSEKSSIPSKLNKKVQEVVKMLFDIDTMKQTMLEFELDLDKMPLGRLSSQQLKQAYQVLTQLSELVAKGASSNEFIGLSNKFFTLIPHNFGMKKAPIIDTMEEIKNKTDILDNLIEVEIAYSLLKDEGNEDSNPIDYHYSQLKTDMTPLKHDSEEFQLIEKYVKNTHAATHKEYSLEVLDVFAINRQGEKRRYKPFKKLHNRQLLWHGSRLTNYVGILSHGLKIAPPEAPVTGYMFGKGIYFADMVSKSANYCFTNKANNVGFMLLSEVALGDMHELTKAQSSIQKPPNGKHSVKGVGKTQPDPTQSIQRDGVTIPLGNSVTNDKLKSDLLYNEYIVYDVAQVNVQYMLKMKFNYHKK